MITSYFQSCVGQRWGVSAACFIWLGIVAGFAGDSPAPPLNTRPGPDLPIAVAKSTPLENSLGMRFVQVPGATAWFSIWETRVRDYRAFCAATGRTEDKPEFGQTVLHPVVNVSWEDAWAFCEWLTSKERKEGRLQAQERYRLPTDREWSAAVGVSAEQGKTPEDRMKAQIVWPWGHYWPPLTGDGNYSPELKADDFAHTSPVGSFKANAFGLHDLGGNVWEWCEDWYNEARVTRVLRGGSFNDALPTYLLAAYRFSGTMNLSNDDIGFRVVLEKSK